MKRMGGPVPGCLRFVKGFYGKRNQSKKFNIEDKVLFLIKINFKLKLNHLLGGQVSFIEDETNIKNKYFFNVKP